MKQLTLASVVGFERYSKTTRQTAFLAEMERVVPWPALCALIKPFYPKPGNGRPPVGIERMLRIYFLQHWFNLSDPAVEETLYDGDAAFFRHQPWSRAGQRLFDELQRHLAVATVTIVDATIINAPTSTKNADKARDPPCIHPNAVPKRPNYPRSLADEEIDMPSTYAPAPYSDDP